MFASQTTKYLTQQSRISAEELGLQIAALDKVHQVLWDPKLALAAGRHMHVSCWDGNAQCLHESTMEPCRVSDIVCMKSGGVRAKAMVNLGHGILTSIDNVHKIEVQRDCQTASGLSGWNRFRECAICLHIEVCRANEEVFVV
jgi:hypothetical protein